MFHARTCNVNAALIVRQGSGRLIEGLPTGVGERFRMRDFKPNRLIICLNANQFRLQLRNGLLFVLQARCFCAVLGCCSGVATRDVGEFRMQLAAALLAAFDALLGPRYIRTEAVETPLHRVEAVVLLCKCNPLAVAFGLVMQLLGDDPLKLDLVRAYALLKRTDLLTQLLPAQCKQFNALCAGFRKQCLIPLGGLCLALKVRNLTTKLAAQIAQAIQVVAGMTDAIFGFAAALFVFRYAGGFLEIHPQFFRFGLNEVTDHSLLDDRIAAWTKAGAEEHVQDVASTAALTVQEVGGLRIPRDLPADSDLAKRRVLATDPAIAVVEQQFNAGDCSGLAAR